MDRQTEMCTHPRAEDLGRKGIGGFRRQQHSLHTRRCSRTQQRAEVPWVADLVGIRMKSGAFGMDRWLNSRTARIPCGVSVSLNEFIRLSETISTSTPRDFRLSTFNLPRSLNASSYNANWKFQLLWIASSTRRTPSTTNTFASRRSLERPSSARTSLILEFCDEVITIYLPHLSCQNLRNTSSVG